MNLTKRNALWRGWAVVNTTGKRWTGPWTLAGTRKDAIEKYEGPEYLDEEGAFAKRAARGEVAALKVAIVLDGDLS